MLVSVIMSVYNEKIEFLKKSTESIIKQTYKNFEYIIVLDNPENNILHNYLKKIAKEDSRITLIVNDANIGLAKSLNKALEVAKGNYIFRMDADDISNLERIEKQLEFMIKENIDISSSLIEFIDEKENSIYFQKKTNTQLHNEIIKKILKYRDLLSHPTWCVKKEVYDNLGGYRELVPVEDYDFLLRASEINYTFGIINEHLLKYRNNHAGISNNNSQKQKISSIVLQNMYGKLNKKTINDIYDNIYFLHSANSKFNFNEYEEIKLKFLTNRIIKFNDIKKIVTNKININFLMADIKIIWYKIINNFYK